MSVWCPKCQTLKNNKPKCHACGFIEEDTSKTWELPNQKKARIVKKKKAIYKNGSS